MFSVELLSDLAILVLGKYLRGRKAYVRTKICTEAFTGVFIMAIKWKQMPISSWMDKYVVDPYSGVLFSNGKKPSPDTSYNTDQPWKHQAKWKKASHKRPDYKMPFMWNIQNSSYHWWVKSGYYRVLDKGGLLKASHHWEGQILQRKSWRD